MSQNAVTKETVPACWQQIIPIDIIRTSLQHRTVQASNASSPGRNRFNPEKIYNKLKFGTMTQDHVLSHQKKSPCFGHGTSPFFGL